MIGAEKNTSPIMMKMITYARLPLILTHNSKEHGGKRKRSTKSLEYNLKLDRDHIVSSKDTPEPVLPLIEKPFHPDLTSITPGTLREVLFGGFGEAFGEVVLIDCRYPYEFVGGHIRGALNVPSCDLLESTIFTSKAIQRGQSTCFVFYCEFSSMRGPGAYRETRSLDRRFNENCYPRLHFPHLYLLEGGYKSFFASFPELCDPSGYVTMQARPVQKQRRNKRPRLRLCSSFNDIFDEIVNQSDELFGNYYGEGSTLFYSQ